MQPEKVMIVTPLFWGDASGASVYYRLLSRALIERGYQVAVASDKEKEGSDVGVSYYSIFPARCGRARRPVRDVVAYGLQNLAYRKLGGLIASVDPIAVIVHSSFYNNIGLFPFALRYAKKKNPCVRFLIDVRDNLARRASVNEFNRYDAVIACSANIQAYLVRNGVQPKRIAAVPVIQETFSSYVDSGKTLTRQLGIDGPYIFYAGLIKESKSVDLLLDVFLNLIRPTRPELQLVMAGLMKTKNRRIRNMLSAAGVVYVGNRCREDVLRLMSQAAVCVNLSENEGMPRSSLEAVALERPVILPPNIPEFSEHAPGFVASEREPVWLSKLILKVLDEKLLPNYPIWMHHPKRVIQSYIDLLGCEGRRSK
jgi:glycosyltransferase involved in cell wall biosynthesis